MRLVAVTRVLNEDDIIEAFARHHAPLLDHHILLDNGSTDGTIEILRSLRSEGMQITVLQNRAPMFSERLYNTMLYRTAATRFSADWVLIIDCDEFVDERDAPGGLRAFLSQPSTADECVLLPLVSYHATPQDDAAELIVPRRIRHHEPTLTETFKCCIRGGAAANAVEIEPGGHAGVRHGQLIPARVVSDLPLAHYYRRSPWQLVTKAVMGRLKVLAAGPAAVESGANFHYRRIYEMIRDDPGALLHDPAFIENVAPAEVIDDPIDYAGGTLRYTLPVDPMMKAIAVMTAYAEQLAQQYGRLIEGNPVVRMVVENMAAQWTQII
jgi:hypothetical protein